MQVIRDIKRRTERLKELNFQISGLKKQLEYAEEQRNIILEELDTDCKNLIEGSN